MKKIYIISFVLLIVLMLYRPQICLFFSLQGLNLWFEKMLPALFPFMIISGIIIKMNLTEDIVGFCAPILRPLFQVSNHVLYGIIVGFLCGFPMGAKVAVQLLESGKVTRVEAEYLLAFCNNIGPIYFLTFVVPTIKLQSVFLGLLGMYLLPLVYGILLRHTLYKRKIVRQKEEARSGKGNEKSDLLCAVDLSIKDAINSIVVLGGYMIAFNTLNLVPRVFLGERYLLVSPFLEITGGIGRMGVAYPFLILCLLPFGGLCCTAQTYSILRGSSLKIQSYLLHKLVLTMGTILYYLVLL